MNIGKNDAERLSFDNTGNTPSSSNLIDSLSNHFIFNTVNNAGSLNYRVVDKMYNWVIGSGFGSSNYQMNDIATNVTRSVAYNNFIPSFTFNYIRR